MLGNVVTLFLKYFQEKKKEEKNPKAMKSKIKIFWQVPSVMPPMSRALSRPRSYPVFPPPWV